MTLLSILLCVKVYMICKCMYMCVHACMGPPRPEDNTSVHLYNPQTYSLEIGSLTKQQSSIFSTELTGQRSPRIHLSAL